MIYLLDTDITIFMLRGLKVRANPNEQQRERLKLARRIFDRARAQATAGHTVAVSAVTVAELEFGAQNSGDYSREIEVVRRALQPFAQLEFDALECAAQYGLVRQRMEAAGNPIGALDTFIAAHALALGAVLVTNNAREFSRVTELKVENWAKQAP